MTTKFNRILFDYDGTLIVHDKENEGKLIGQMLNLPEEQIEEFVKRIDHFFGTAYGKRYYANKKMTYKLYYSIMNIMMKPWDFGLTVEAIDAAINEKSKYDSVIEPTAKSTLEYLSKKGYQLCVFTNGFLYPQTDNMKYKGIYEYFDRIYAWDDQYAKPDIRAFERALAGTDPQNNIMIGDSLTSDILPAKSLGIYTIGINTSSNSSVDIKPDKCIKTLSQLKRIL